MRIILDNNVLLSAAFFKNSVPDMAFEKARSKGTLLRSFPTLKELVAVMNRSKFDKYLTFKDRIAFIRKYIEMADSITIAHTVEICRDEKDNRYLELALSGQADCIVTGDKDLLALHPFENITIISPSDFLDNF